MVRVTCPPGGGGPLSESTRQPKTVRVLKPPGGGSSISFGDDPEPVRKPSVPAKVEEAPKESPVEESPKKETPEESPKKEATPPPQEAPKEAAPVQEKTNGTTTNGTSTPPLAPTNGTASPTPSPSPETLPVEALTVSDSSPEFESPQMNGHSTPSEPDVVEAPAPAPVTPDIVVSSKPILAPLKIQSPPPASSSSPSPTVTSPTSSNGDTRDSSMNGAASPQGDTTPRKVKDHMRSNIFGSSEQDYTPTRSSRFNAQVVTPESNGISNAGQRGRVPPGGFSSKLW